MTRNSPEGLEHSIAVLRSDLGSEASNFKRVGNIDQPSRLARLAESITGEIQTHPGRSLVIASACIAAGLLVFAQGSSLVSNYQDHMSSPEAAEIANKNKIVTTPYIPYRDGDIMRKEFAEFGLVTDTVPVAMKVIVPEGLNVRRIPGKHPGSKVGAIPSYKNDPDHQMINVSHFMDTPDGNIHALYWGTPEENNDRPINVVTVKEDGRYYANFVTGDGEEIPGRTFFAQSEYRVQEHVLTVKGRVLARIITLNQPPAPLASK